MPPKLIVIVLIVASSHWSWVVADSDSTLNYSEEQPELAPYSLPVTERLGKAILKATEELNISVFEFYSLRGMKFHTKQTTQLTAVSGNAWRLDFVAVPDNAISTLVSQNTLETTKGPNGKLLPIPELVIRLKEDVKKADPTGNNLKRIRQFEDEVKKASVRIWSVD